MRDSVNNEKTAPQAKIPRSAAAKIVRIFAIIGVAFVVFILLLIAFTETSYFRAVVKNFIIRTSDSTFTARLEIGDLEGNIYSGWTIKDVRLIEKSGPIIEVESLVLRYNLLNIPWKRIDIKELTLNSPKIYITNASGRGWNITSLLRDTTEAEPEKEFDWRLVLRNVRIVDGLLIVYDSTRERLQGTNRLDESHLCLDKINLTLNADIAPKSKRISINQFSFLNTTGDVNIENISGDIHLTRNSNTIKDLSIQTNRSRILLSVDLDSISFLEDFPFEKFAASPMRIDLEAPVVDTKDLQYFFSDLDFLGTAPALTLKLSGSLKSLAIKTLTLASSNTRIDLLGTLRNIDEGGDLFIDVMSDETQIDAADLAHILPGINLSDFSEAGYVRFRKLVFTGQPLNFTGEIDLESENGSLNCAINMDFSGDDPIYDTQFKTRRLNLGKIFRQPSLNSALTLEATLKGRGVTPGRMKAVAEIRADTSRFQRYSTDLFNLAVSIRPDSLNFTMNSASGSSRIALNSGISFRKDSITGFRMKANARSIDLAKILNDDSMSSNLTFSVLAEGNSVSLADASGFIDVTFAPSRFRTLSVEHDTLTVSLDQTDRKLKNLSISSHYADFNISGEIDIPRFIDFLGLQVDSLSKGFSEFSLEPDTTRIREKGRKPERALVRDTRAQFAGYSRDTTDFVNVKYALDLKQPEHLAKYFDASLFIVRGKYSGSMAGGFSGLNITGNVNVSDFYYVDSSTALLAAGIRFNYNVRDLTPFKTMERLKIHTTFSASDIHYDELRLSNLSGLLSYENRQPRLAFRGFIDTVLFIDINGNAQIVNHRYLLNFPRFSFAYLGQPWRNELPAQIALDKSSIDIQTLKLYRNETRLSLSGKRFFKGKNEFSFRADSVRVGELEYFITGNKNALENKSFTGTALIEANLTGTDADPMMAIEAYIETLGYQKATFGELQMEGRYNNRILEIYSELSYPVSESVKQKVFFASGSLPIDLAFSGEESRELPGYGNLRIQMKSFPLRLIEKMTGMFSPLHGEANADITIKGTSDNLRYAGFLDIENARGRFLYNNMDYLIRLRLEPQEERILIKEFALRNDPTDWKDGLIAAEGYIDTDGMNLSRFDIKLNGKLKILRQASRSVIKTLYGDLYVATGDQGLSISGRTDRSLFTGIVKIIEGDLVLPQEYQQAEVRRYTNITYIDIDDVSKEKKTSLSEARLSRQASLFGRAIETDTSAAISKPAGSVLDIFTYDLEISTYGNLRIVIPFSTLTQEELTARLNIERLKVNNWQGEGKFVGSVSLGPESYYLYFGKRFDASGSLTFTRDPEDPDLNLKATYSDYHTNKATGERRKVFVIINISGTRNKPEITFDMRYDSPDSPSRPRAGDMQSDAFSFILFGQFTDELTGSEKGRILDQADALGKTVGSSLFSGVASQLISTVGLQDVFRRVEVGGLGTQDARLKVTSEIGRAIITYDGKIDNLGSSDIVAEFPMSMFFPNFAFGNMVVQFSRKTSNIGVESSSTTTQENAIWEVKLLYRFSL